MHPQPAILAHKVTMGTAITADDLKSYILYYLIFKNICCCFQQQTDTTTTTAQAEPPPNELLKMYGPRMW
ncbi:unnamed protein product [Rodentolepis nana]|uniref:Uncharacterized protein n=1 Tax=Rodentolepis nana TaxID=102285 RepID=A0A0R3TI94_RODNA|nr:unnamed protein product [Rodentolepis nana]